MRASHSNTTVIHFSTRIFVRAITLSISLQYADYNYLAHAGDCDCVPLMSFIGNIMYMHASAHCLCNLYCFFKMRKHRNSGIPLACGDVDSFCPWAAIVFLALAMDTHLGEPSLKTEKYLLPLKNCRHSPLLQDSPSSILWENTNMVCCLAEFTKTHFASSTLVGEFTHNRSGETIMRESKGLLKLNSEGTLEG